MNDNNFREWSLTIKNGKIYPYPTIGKDIETIPVIEKKAYDDLLAKTTEMSDMLAKYQKNSEELIAIIEKQKLQLKQLDSTRSMTFEEFFKTAKSQSQRR